MKAKLICAAFLACLFLHACHQNESKDATTATQDIPLAELPPSPKDEEQQIPVQQPSPGLSSMILFPR